MGVLTGSMYLIIGVNMYLCDIEKNEILFFKKEKWHKFSHLVFLSFCHCFLSAYACVMAG